MSQKDLNYTAAEPFKEQDPFTDSPFTDGSFTDGPFTDAPAAGGPFLEGPFTQGPASREAPEPGAQEIFGAAEEDLPVEEAFARLEQLIRRMESEDISLEDSFACYEQGIRLVRYCNERIDQVEKKVQILRGEGFSQSPPDSREG